MSELRITKPCDDCELPRHMRHCMEDGATGCKEYTSYMEQQNNQAN